MQTAAWLILLFPLAGCVVLGLGFRTLPARVVGAIGTLAIAAAFVALYGVGFLLATAAAAFATFLPTWLSLLIVSLVLLAASGVLAAVARSRIRRGTPPMPEQAIEEARRTTEAIRP